jgi:hypothetical protein
MMRNSCLLNYISSLIIMLIVAAGCCATQNTTATSPPVSQTGTGISPTSPPATSGSDDYSRLVASFNGLGNGETPVFEVSDPTWRVEYSCWRRDSAEMMRFSLFIYPANERLNYFDSVLFIPNPLKDSLLETSPAGGYYLKIIGYNSFWAINIYE